MSERTGSETDRAANNPAMTERAFAILGGGKIAYVKPIRSEDVHKLYPQAPELQPGMHLFALHALAVLYAWWLVGFEPLLGKPDGYGLGLAGIYAVWLVVVIGLTPLCRWFAAVKKRGRAWWWSYL